MSPKNKTTVDLFLGTEALPNEVAVAGTVSLPPTSTISTETAKATTGGTQTDPDYRPPRKRRKPPGSTVDVQPGARGMKGYPLTERDMKDLLAAGRESNRFFALSGAGIGFAANIAMQLMLSSGEPASDVALWKVIGWIIFGLSVFLGLHGWSKQDEGEKRLEEIISQTVHEED